MKVHHTSPEALVPAGDIIIGEAWVRPLVAPDEGLDIVLVSFSAGARTYLHTHDVPQVLHCVEGAGILATERERNVVGPGDVVYVPANEPHWHGATAEGPFTHLSIRPPGETHWTKIDPLAEG